MKNLRKPEPNTSVLTWYGNHASKTELRYLGLLDFNTRSFNDGPYHTKDQSYGRTVDGLFVFTER